MKERYGYEENITGYWGVCFRITLCSCFVLLFMRRSILNFALLGHVGVNQYGCTLAMVCYLSGCSSSQRLKNKKNLKSTTI